MPPTTSEAQYSLPFAVGTMLKNGFIGLPEISGEGLKDPDVGRLVACTEMVVAPHLEERYPIGRWADVTLTLADGRVLNSGEVHARGGPENPSSEAEVIDKFMAFASPVLGAGRATAIRDACLALPEGGDFARLLRLLKNPL
jgi:2-methylcitrate dehydratase PrpD